MRKTVTSIFYPPLIVTVLWSQELLVLKLSIIYAYTLDKNSLKKKNTQQNKAFACNQAANLNICNNIFSLYWTIQEKWQQWFHVLNHVRLSFLGYVGFISALFHTSAKLYFWKTSLSQYFSTSICNSPFPALWHLINLGAFRLD